MRRFGALARRKKSPEASRAHTLIDVARTDLERKGYEPLVIDWRNARKRKNGYSARMMGYPETHLARAKAHVRTKDIADHSKDRSPYGRGLAQRVIAPDAEEGILRYYLAYGVKAAAEVLGIPGHTISAVAHRNGVQRTRRDAIRFAHQGKSLVRWPTPEAIRGMNAAWLKERHAYRKAQKAVHLRPEGFVDVAGWEGHYAVSRDGRVWSYPSPGKRRGRFLRPARQERSNGYRRRKSVSMIVILGRMVGRTYQTKNITLAQLVARAFLPNPNGHRFVRTKDGDPANCHVDNLEWVSGAEMTARMHSARRARIAWKKNKGTTVILVGTKAPPDFVDIPGWEGLYAASPDGRIWCYPKVQANGCMAPGRFKHPTVSGKGCYVGLGRDRRQKSYMVARLIATMFLPNPESKPFVHNKSGVTADCSVGNLEWIYGWERAVLTNIARDIRLAGGEIANHPDWLNWREKPVRRTRQISARHNDIRLRHGRSGLDTPLSDSAPDGFIDIPGWEGRYAVSRGGQVYRYARVTPTLRVREGGIMRRAWHSCIVALLRDGRYTNMQVQYLVARAFLERKRGQTHVLFKNGLRGDCRAENLQWVTAKEWGAARGALVRQENDILIARNLRTARFKKAYLPVFKSDARRPRRIGPHPWRLAEHRGYLKHMAMKSRTTPAAA